MLWGLQNLTITRIYDNMSGKCVLSVAPCEGLLLLNAVNRSNLKYPIIGYPIMNLTLSEILCSRPRNDDKYK